jgi:hypothetical protein
MVASVASPLPWRLHGRNSTLPGIVAAYVFAPSKLFADDT